MLTTKTLSHLSRRDALLRSLDYARRDFIAEAKDRFEAGDRVVIREFKVLDDMAEHINLAVDLMQIDFRHLDIAKDSNVKGPESHMKLRAMITETITEHYPLTQCSARYLSAAVEVGAGVYADSEMSNES